ncbi:hypothetical protein C2S51_022089 [Perilla frutescens var. frutescens]|nr:hypothetical protein C2S51_022089 [Perilla frutescens var. frutescens]
MIVVIIIASAVIISASIYLLLRVVSKRFRRSFSTTADDVVSRRGGGASSNHVTSNDLLDSLPLFTFRSVARNLNGGGGDCAVCLSKFEPHDQLRLLPLCCHAFHAACIDKWIVSNQTCPLCRSTVLPSGSDALDKILSAGNANSGSFRDGNGGGSFRIELGSISLRRGGAAAEEGARRTYSLGSFEYIVDDCVCEVAVGYTSHRGGFSEKESSEAAAEEDRGRRNWVREYVASISSRTMSFRSSGRFFSGRSVVPEDLEANRAGEEISEIFRWISGI